MILGLLTKKDIVELQNQVDLLSAKCNELENKLVEVSNREYGLYSSTVITMPNIAEAVTFEGYFIKEITGLFTIINGQPVQLSKYGVGVNQQGQFVNCNLSTNIGQTVFVLFKY